MLDPTKIDATLIQQMAALHGLELSLERAQALVPALQAIVAADAKLAQIDLADMPSIGLPWETDLFDNGFS